MQLIWRNRIGVTARTGVRAEVLSIPGCVAPEASVTSVGREDNASAVRSVGALAVTIGSADINDIWKSCRSINHVVIPALTTAVVIDRRVGLQRSEVSERRRGIHVVAPIYSG